MDGENNAVVEPIDVQLEQQEQAPPAKTYTPEEVTQIVQRERQRAMNKAQGQSQGFGGMPSNDDIRKLIAEEAPRYLQEQARQAQIQNLVQSFSGKIDAAKESLPDLESRLNELEITPAFTPIIAMANDLPNTAQIMHELTANPMKMGYVVSLMQSQPKMAAKAMYELSQSISQNEQAVRENQESRAPLDQIRSSAKASADDGKLSIKDYRKMFR